jgi:hypothetical protein
VGSDGAAVRAPRSSSSSHSTAREIRSRSPTSGSLSRDRPGDRGLAISASQPAPARSRIGSGSRSSGRRRTALSSSRRSRPARARGRSRGDARSRDAVVFEARVDIGFGPPRSPPSWTDRGQIDGRGSRRTTLSSPRQEGSDLFPSRGRVRFEHSFEGSLLSTFDPRIARGSSRERRSEAPPGLRGRRRRCPRARSRLRELDRSSWSGLVAFTGDAASAEVSFRAWTPPVFLCSSRIEASELRREPGLRERARRGLISCGLRESRASGILRGDVQLGGIEDRVGRGSPFQGRDRRRRESRALEAGIARGSKTSAVADALLREESSRSRRDRRAAQAPSIDARIAATRWESGRRRSR